jgi:DNA-binding transcriptional LysR family regulator
MAVDLRRLRYFLTLTQHRNFSQAAAALQISQPALTRSIQSLERTLGLRLLDRGRSGVWPTPVGQRLAELSEQLLGQSSRLESDLRLMAGLESGFLRVGAGPYAADISLGTALARFVERHPGIQVDVATSRWSTLASRVLTSDLDLAIVHLPDIEQSERLDTVPLPRHQAYFFCGAGHPLAGQPKVSLRELRSYSLVATSLPASVVEIIGADARSAATAAAGKSIPGIRVDTMPFVRQIVAGSTALGIATLSQLRAGLDSGELRMLPLVLPRLKTQYGIVRVAGRTPSPAAAAFVEILREVETEISVEELPGGRFCPPPG